MVYTMPKKHPEITRDGVRRVLSGRVGIMDPCTICGAKLGECTHVFSDMQAFARKVRQLSRKELQAILDQGDGSDGQP